MPRASKPDVLIALDFGGSSTKVLYQRFGDAASNFLIMQPEVAPLTQSTVEQFQMRQFGISAPEHCSWVCANNQCHAVGSLAKNHFYAHAGLAALKYERAVYKTLAATWVIQQRLNLRPSFKAAIACLLPPGEYEDRVRLQARLGEALYHFNTPTGTLRVMLERFDCKPECGGIALMHWAKLGNRFAQQVFGFVMLGYRNASVLVADRGMFNAGKTSDLGFVRCIEKVMSQTSGYSSAQLLNAIATAAQEQSLAPYIRIAHAREDAERIEEARHLAIVVEQARAEYAHMLLSWLDEVLPLRNCPDLHLVFCGGTADLLQQDLMQYYSHYPHLFHAGITLPKVLESDMGNRLVDVYGLFQMLCRSVGLQESISAASA
jgi:hypothetical protein